MALPTASAIASTSRQRLGTGSFLSAARVHAFDTLRTADYGSARRGAHARASLGERAGPLGGIAATNRRAFSIAARLQAKHFDTHGFVTRLEASGMPREQADALVTALGDVVEESIKNLERGLVSREEGERWRYSQKVDFARLKSDVQLIERNDFTLMKSENERLMADVEKLKQRLREEVTRTVAGVRLDLNLEKGRIRDESSVHALKIKEVDTRIEAEIAGLRSTIATAKINVLQYLVGVATGAGALLLAYLRMFK